MVQVSEGQGWILDMVDSIIIEVLSSIAEQERETIRERQRQGTDAAKAKNKYLGRSRIKMPDNFGQVYSGWKRGEYTAKIAMKSTGFY